MARFHVQRETEELRLIMVWKAANRGGAGFRRGLRPCDFYLKGWRSLFSKPRKEWGTPIRISMGKTG